MLKDNISQHDSNMGNFHQLGSRKSITKVIEHIEEYLPNFIFESKSKGIRVEKGLNHLFVRIMDCHDLFQFMNEDLEDPTRGNSPAIDIGIYTRGDSSTRFFAIEAKRLDTGIANYAQRKKEYVVNNNGGGIERFKKAIHGTELLCAGMIGYIQTDDFTIWENRINNYIKEEIESSTIGISWSSDDLLKLEKLNTIYATYGSKHLRSAGDEIDLYHIWIQL